MNFVLIFAAVKISYKIFNTMGLKKEVIRLDQAGNEVERFECVTQVSKLYSLTDKQVRDICQKKVYPISENHIFRYACDVEKDREKGVSLVTNVFRSPSDMSNKKLTTEEFIQRARTVHGGKYDYSKAVYKTTHEKVCIICPEHGEFWQEAIVHLNGSGCPKCLGRHHTTEEMIERFKKIYGDAYTYDKVVYTRGLDKICVTCPKHGDFWVTPKDFLRGSGCPTCGHESSAETRRMPVDEFIHKAREIHGDKYDYSKLSYKTIAERVTIICPVHGEFRQKGYDHLQGHGCALCNESSLERQVRVFLEKKGIKFIPQASGHELAWLERLSLDFYLTDHNIAIECHGRQHFESVDKFGGEDTFLRIIERDKRKKSLCDENGISVLYYSDLFPEDNYELGHVIPTLDELNEELAQRGVDQVTEEKDDIKPLPEYRNGYRNRSRKVEKPFKCPYCDKSFDNYRGLNNHVINFKIHGPISKEQLLIDYKYGGERPKCKCGCGEYTELNPNGGLHFNAYVIGHNRRSKRLIKNKEQEDKES